MSDKSVWRAPDPLVLASKSAIRKTLLDQAGLSPEILVPDFDERQFERDHPLASHERAQRLADEKALAVSRHHPKAWVIGADQTLECGGEIFSKPVDRQNAAQQLSRLQGRTHILKSGTAVARGGERVAHPRGGGAEPLPIGIRDFGAGLGADGGSGGGHAFEHRLGRRRQPHALCPPILGVGHPFDKPGRLEAVEKAGQAHLRDTKPLGQQVLADRRAARDMRQIGRASCRERVSSPV